MGDRLVALRELVNESIEHDKKLVADLKQALADAHSQIDFLKYANEELQRDRDRLQNQLDDISKAMSIAGLLKPHKCHFCNSPIPKGQEHIFEQRVGVRSLLQGSVARPASPSARRARPRLPRL